MSSKATPNGDAPLSETEQLAKEINTPAAATADAPKANSEFHDRLKVEAASPQPLPGHTLTFETSANAPDIQRTIDTGYIYFVRLPIVIRADGLSNEWTLIKIGKTQSWATSRFRSYANEMTKQFGIHTKTTKRQLPTHSMTIEEPFQSNYLIAVEEYLAWCFLVHCSSFGMHHPETHMYRRQCVADGKIHEVESTHPARKSLRDGWVAFQLQAPSGMGEQEKQRFRETFLQSFSIKMYKGREPWIDLPCYPNPMHRQLLGYIVRDENTEGCEAAERLLRGLFGTPARVSWFTLPGLTAKSCKWAPTEVVIVPNIIVERIESWFRKTLQTPTTNRHQFLRLRQLIHAVISDLVFSYHVNQRARLYSTLKMEQGTDTPYLDDGSAVILLDAKPSVNGDDTNELLQEELQHQLRDANATIKALEKKLSQTAHDSLELKRVFAHKETALLAEEGQRHHDLEEYRQSFLHLRRCRDRLRQFIVSRGMADSTTLDDIESRSE